MPYPPWLRTGPEPSAEQRARRSLRTRAFAAALSGLVQLPGLAIAIMHVTHGAAGGDGAVVLASTISGLVAAVSLLVPQHGPRVLLVAVFALPAIAFAVGPPAAGLAVAFAVVGAVTGGAAGWAWSCLAGMGTIGATVLVVAGGGSGGIRTVVVTIVLCIVAAAATGAGNRRDRFRAAAREEAVRRRTAAEEERLRIARELHDVLAHSLSQISVQAGVGLHLFDDEPERARQSLRSIRETSTSALDEVRAVLGVLREPTDAQTDAAPRSPQPMLANLPGLIADAEASGLSVSLTGLSGDTDRLLPSPVQSAAYRIVQESLTNVLRHAHTSTADVRLAIERNALSIVVDNDRPDGRQDAPPHGAQSHDSERAAGRGIQGMRERAEALGGTLTAHATVHGGYRVTARLPLPEGRHA